MSQDGYDCRSCAVVVQCGPVVLALCLRGFEGTDYSRGLISKTRAVGGCDAVAQIPSVLRADSTRFPNDIIWPTVRVSVHLNAFGAIAVDVIAVAVYAAF